MSTTNERIRPEEHPDHPEIEEEDETDGWGPVRVRRSSVPLMPAQQAAEPARDAAGNIIDPRSRDRSRTLR